MKLRDYQKDAIDAALGALRNNKTTIIEAATGAGKSVIICGFLEIAKKARRRALVITHNQDLVLNNHKTWLKYSRTSGLDVSICCSGLGRRSVGGSLAVFASVETYKSMVDEDSKYDLVIVDECHRVNSEEGTYHDLFKSCFGEAKIIGLTATPYRTGKGAMEDHEGAIFDNVCYRIGIKALIENGSLTVIKSLGSKQDTDVSGSVVSGRIDDGESVDKIHENIDALCSNIKKHIFDKKRISVIIFVPRIDVIDDFVENLNMHRDIEAIGIDGSAKKKQRKQCIDFLEHRGLGGKIRVVVNVNLLTTGVSIDRVDTIVFARSMDSSGLMVQMAGRGMRRHKDKSYCLLLDYGMNLVRLGSIDDPVVRKAGDGGEPPMKLCGNDDCLEINYAAARECIACGFVFDIEEGSKIGSLVASDQAAISEDIFLEVDYIDVDVHVKTGSPKMVKLTYMGVDGGVLARDFLCINHKGFAQTKAMELISSLCIENSTFVELGGLGVLDDAEILAQLMDTQWYKYFHKIVKIQVEKVGRFFNIIDRFVAES